MFYQINNILEKLFGVRIAKIKKNSIEKLKSKKPLIIEFTGLSGVGKSVIFSPLINLKEDWWEDGRFIRQHQNFLNDTEISNLIDSNHFYQELAELKIESTVSSNFINTDKLRLLRNYEYYIKSDAILNSKNTDSIVCADEGLIHYFGNEIKTLIETGKYMQEIDRVLKNRIIIYCYAKPDTIANRIFKRKEETGRLSPQHKVDTFEELVEVQNKDLIQKNELMDFFQNHSVPVLFVNTEDELDQNVSKVINFIQNYI